jgi:hypothetical protein
MKNYPEYSIPVAENVQYFKEENPSGSYSPNHAFVKESKPNYSFGYPQEIDYRTETPAPNIYNIRN